MKVRERSAKAVAKQGDAAPAPRPGAQQQAASREATPAPKGLIDVPAPPPAPVATAVAARLDKAWYDGFMKMRRFDVDIARPGSAQIETRAIDVLSGPGHNCSMAAPLVIGPDGLPSVVLKAGDTRAARLLRGEPYVRIGMIGGRWDKVGADAKKIGLEEIAEEIGAKLVPNGYLALGDKLSPTMPHESTEADRYFVALVRLEDGAAPPAGDGGGMEVAGLMKPVAMSVAAGLKAMDDGSVGEGARARTAYARAFDKIGYIPELGRYVHDIPALRKQFDTMGLGAAIDPRPLAADGKGDAIVSSHGIPDTAPDPDGVKVNGASFVSKKEIPVSEKATFLDASTTHVARADDGTEKVVGKPFPNQLLHLTYDRAKIAVFYRDPVQGPMVRFDAVERPALAAKALAMDAERTYKDENTDLVARDVLDVEVPLEKDGAASAAQKIAKPFGAKAVQLGAPCDASPGQSDLRLHFYGVEIAPPEDRSAFLSLADALRMIRANGEADAATEALLHRLAAHEGWIPSLRMSVATAKKIAG